MAGADLLPIFSKPFTINEQFIDGSVFSYTSIARRLEDDFGTNPIRGLQIILRARNRNDVDILNTLGIIFTNECNVFPLFEVGDRIGWTELIDFQNPVVKWCPGK